MAAVKKIKLLRSSDVLAAGSCVIERPEPVTVSAEGNAKQQVLSSDIARQARIIESNSEYAVIEVTCSCGAKTHVQCNYAEMTAG